VSRRDKKNVILCAGTAMTIGFSKQSDV